MVPRNILRQRAEIFAKDYADTTYEKGEAHTFYDRFFSMFDRDRRDMVLFERKANNLSGNPRFIDLLWSGVLLAEHKSAGHDLEKAMEQAEKYYLLLEDEEKPRYMLACDFQRWKFMDLESAVETNFTLAELPNNLQLFDFMHKDGTEFKPDALSVDAAKMMADLHGKLKNNRYDPAGMEYFLTRLVFCMFAERVGIFESGLFTALIHRDKRPGAVEVGGKMVQLFETLNTPEDKREISLPDYINKFPYVNGNLFDSAIKMPSFDVPSRGILLEALKFDWSEVSPIIFGSLFQNTMDTDERRREGAHYTPEENIMKVIRPLFLDDLEAEFTGICRGPNSKKALEAFLHKLSGLTFFDPACGAGNFLVVAYRELRRLETKAIKALYGDQHRLDVSILTHVDVDQFYGIELNPFSARIAEIAMWMTDHKMNLKLGEVMGDVYTRIPIKNSPSITCGDALKMDWNGILDSKKCDYVFGNPPFAGANNMGRDRLAETISITGSGVLDYVCNWFVKATKYAGQHAGIGFVATNSITQGEQAHALWSALKPHGVHIQFAHTTFKWDSDTTGKASVHVVIVGMRKGADGGKRRLFHNGMEENPRHISPYLHSASNETVTVAPASKAANGFPKLMTGTEPRDGKNCIFDEFGMTEFLKNEPGAEEYMRPYIGGKDYIRGDKRWILFLGDAEPSDLRSMPRVMKVIKNVEDFRAQSTNEPTKNLPPTSFYITVIPENPFLVIPKTTSGIRDYVPIGYAKPPAMPGDSTKIIENADLGLFGLLTSHMHMVWLRGIGGELKSDSRYSINIVYNTFPVPDNDLKLLEPLAQTVLDARANHEASSLADLYDRHTMPMDLRKAHTKLDRAVDRMYRKEGFLTDADRLEFLLEFYAKNTASSVRVAAAGSG